MSAYICEQVFVYPLLVNTFMYSSKYHYHTSVMFSVLSDWQLFFSLYLSSNFGLCACCRVIILNPRQVTISNVSVFVRALVYRKFTFQWENFDFLLRCPYSQAYFTLSTDSDISGAGHPRFSPEEWSLLPLCLLGMQMKQKTRVRNRSLSSTIVWFCLN